jgi:stage III sporulation protein AD
MEIVQILTVGVLGAVLALTVKKQNPETALTITIACSVLIFFMVLPLLRESIALLARIGGMLDGGMPYVALAVKVIGVAYMAELGASICADAGESAIAAKIDLAGRLIVLVLAVPVIIDIVQLLAGLLP